MEEEKKYGFNVLLAVSTGLDCQVIDEEYNNPTGTLCVGVLDKSDPDGFPLIEVLVFVEETKLYFWPKEDILLTIKQWDKLKVIRDELIIKVKKSMDKIKEDDLLNKISGGPHVCH
jgi:hypothetical protein